MEYYADLHIHSRFSRATSKELDLGHLNVWAQRKGITVVGTGDCVHPGWLGELEEKLVPAGDGLFSLKDEHARVTNDLVPPACRADVRFALSAEISNIYKRMDKVRKVHNVVFVPSFDAARKLQARLEAIGNVRSDGRPILGLDSRDLLEIVLETGPQSFLVPAHIWTPWFSALGSKGGFDRIADCYGDLADQIFAVETGLSSDPPMNWRLKQLDPYVLISNSDAHSPSKLGREANLFDTELSYTAMLSALKDPHDKGFLGTVEFFPQEGKYHFDGHRKCEMRMHPRETIENRGLCPVCGKKATVGVMARVEELADRPEGAKSARWRDYRSMVPLQEVLGEAMSVGANSKRVAREYTNLLAHVGSEFTVLTHAPLEDIARCAGVLAAEGICRMRQGRVHIAEGYDGEYGTVTLFEDGERETISGQVGLFAGSGPGTRKSRAKKRAGPASGAAQTVHAAAEKPSGERPGPAAVAEPEQHVYGGRPGDLNEAQWDAVQSGARALLIVAGPGTGKTHTLTHRIAHLARTMEGGRRFLAITFTNKAAEEMRERIRKRVPEGLAAQIDIGTFHWFCLGVLREHYSRAGLPDGFAIVTPAEVRLFARHIWPDRTVPRRSALLEDISRHKSRAPGDAKDPEVARYDRFLRERGLIDFDDILRETWRLLDSGADVRSRVQAMYRHVFIDEYQDINEIQHALLALVVGKNARVTAIGDPNQAIYGFRGSDVRFFEAFESSFEGARTIGLSENYRTSADLLAACDQVMRKDTRSVLPQPVARLHAGGRLTVREAPTDRAEAEYVVHQVERLVGGTTFFSRDSGRVSGHEEGDWTFGDIGVVYRLNAQRAILEEAFARSGIPFRVSGERELASLPIVQDTIALLRLVSGRRVLAERASALLARTIIGDGDGAAASARACWAKHRTVDMGLFAAAPEAGRLRDDIESLEGALAERGLCQTLDIISALPPWRKEIEENERTRESWGRLMQLARVHAHVDGLLDHVSLQRADDSAREGEKVSLMTLHAAKGLEFAAVFIVGCERGLLPLDIAGMKGDGSEERRLFYVGMTRAKQRLYLVRAKRRTLYGKTYETVRSPFLADIEEQLKRYDRTEKARGQKREEAEQLSFL
ncbi:MAG: AAA family ATPase [Chitinivibrionales bacterium]|nr:AAA family ATPase [Chitinivibrionales bacterium]MBD3394994.1 AAA family ATPase [Chitinivibrionales bacterium]